MLGLKFLLPILLSSAFVFGQQVGNDDYILHHRFYSVEDGLASRFVNDATMDSRGFMWFATIGGLSRFDGKDFVSFRINNGLKSNSAEQVAADKKGHLFVISIETDAENQVRTYAQAFDVYTNSFLPVSSVFSKLPFPEHHILNIHCDSLGNTFFVKSKPFQVWRVNTKGDFKLLGNLTQWDQEFKDLALNLASLKFKFIAGGNDLYLNCNYLNKGYILADGGAYSVELPYNQPVHLMPNSELVYIKPGDAGYHSMDSKGNDISTVNPIPNPLLWEKSTQYYPSAINSVSVALCRDAANKNYLVYNNSLIDISGIQGLGAENNKGIIKFVQAGKDRFWVLTNVGAYYLSVAERHFTNYFKSSRGANFTGSPMRGVLDEREKFNTSKEPDLLIASAWDRLIIRQGKTEKNLPVNGMPYAVIKNKGAIYYGTFCLWKLDLGTFKSTRLDSVLLEEVLSIFPLNDSLLITGRRTAMYVYNTNSGKTYRIDHSAKGFPKPFFVRRFIRTQTHGLVAVAENGLYLLNDKGETIGFYGSNASNKANRLPYTGIMDVCEDAQGMVWLALREGGLVRWNCKAQKPLEALNFKQFGLYDGLPSEQLCRIEADAFGCLWISTYNGLVRFNLRDFSTRIFTTRDGLTHNEFNSTSSFVASDGRFYFGGIEGLNAFYPKDLAQKEAVIDFPFQLTRLTKYSEKADSTVDCMPLMRNAATLVMDVGDTYLNIAFSLLDFVDRKHRYAYKIEGVNSDWQYSDQNSLLLSGLPYGNLTLIIKAQLEDGLWNPTEIRIPIQVLKPFYLKAWFIVLCGFLLAGCIVLYFQLKQKRLLRNKHMLETTVFNRTASLKNVIEQRELLIKEIHHRVRNNLQTISGLLQLQKDTLRDEHLLAVLNEGQSRINSIALLHQSLYQNEDLVHVDIEPFFTELARKISELFDSYHRKIALQIDMEKLLLDVDTAMPLGLILNELLTNSLKYAGTDQDQVRVHIAVKQLQEGRYELSYFDSGPGLPAGIDFTHPETLGLRLIKGLAKQVGGDIQYRYGENARFVLSFRAWKNRGDT